MVVSYNIIICQLSESAVPLVLSRIINIVVDMTKGPSSKLNVFFI